jgi:hypothetical protein
LHWLELQIEAGELAVRVAGGADEASEPFAAGAARCGWTESAL